jgi:hypothetical protein
MLKKYLLLAFLWIGCHGLAQETILADEAAVRMKVNAFFMALEKQDTLILKKLWFSEGQVWAINNTTSPMTHSMRFFKDDLKGFDPKIILQERALSYDIKVHKGMAMAWIPYDFHVNGEFSHCGVDIFSLIKIENDWKFISASYTVEKTECDDLTAKP